MQLEVRGHCPLQGVAGHPGKLGYGQENNWKKRARGGGEAHGVADQKNIPSE
jgi:hypothetical protein